MKKLSRNEKSPLANDRLPPDISRLIQAALEFLFLAIPLTIVPFLVFIDVSVLKNGVGEISVTEFTQETLLATSAAIFFYRAWRKPAMRGFLALVAGFFTCMLIRELDVFFDHIWHGFWFWPAIITAGASIASATFLWRDSVIRPMADFVGSHAYVHILIGLLTVLVFSRIFGSGNLIWIELLGEAYSSNFRSAIQEGIELYGYLFIAYGSFLTLRREKPRDSIHD